jgi:flagellar hook-associated protein 3 FlgL
MQNNSLYNINNNKVTEDQLNSMMATGKKITRPSDDPVIAIRSLRLRSNVVQLSQYYEKNAKDAESWLDVTADALSTITTVLTDCVKQATKGANKDLTLDDMDIIVTQLDALSKEYYSTGNADFAGRYVFTGFRTETPLTFDKKTAADYTDINDEFNSRAIGTSSRVLNKHLLDSSDILNATSTPVYEHDIEETTVGRLRLSYDNLNYKTGDGNTAELRYREELTQPATSVLGDPIDVINLTYKTNDGDNRTVTIPVDNNGDYLVRSEGIEYHAYTDNEGNYKITATDISTNIIESSFSMNKEGIMESFAGNVDSAITSLDSKQVTTVTFTADSKISVRLPLLPAVGQSYEVALDIPGFIATVNSDGTYKIKDNNTANNSDGSERNTIVNVTGNGSINSSYSETVYVFDQTTQKNIIYATDSEATIDAMYKAINDGEKQAVFNAATGEILLGKALEQKLSTLPDIINANTIDAVYDKKEWEKGDIKPEHLFSCEYTDDNGKTILYNKGSAPHDIAYDVGYTQSVVVNSTADEVFTTSVMRDVSDLSKILTELKELNGTLNTLNSKLTSDLSESNKAKINAEIAAAQKAYNYLREEIQKEFEHKISSYQNALDIANIAVTSNGTRSKRLDLVNQRLMNQTTTFKELQSDNEDVDLAEAATKLTTAQVTYEASLMATGKISQSSLINYI